MIAPITLAVAEILSAEKTNGSEAGTRRRQRIFQRPAAYECISSSARGSTAWRPRSVLIATGKNVRYAAITATETHGVTPFVPSPTTTIGAIASSGTVWEATMYGTRPRLRNVEWASTTARKKPTIAPSANPARASLAVKIALWYR